MGVIVTSDQVRAQIAKIWPDLQFVLLSDPQWLCPTEAELARSLALCALDRPPYIGHLFECEEFSLDFVASVRRRRAEAAQQGQIPSGQWLNWPLGLVVGTRFHGRDIDHWQNICLTRDSGILLIEPQNGQVWTPRADADSIYFLMM